MDEYNSEKFSNVETAHKLPLGWIILFVVLVAFGVYYTVSYTPGLSDWSQEKSYQESLK